MPLKSAKMAGGATMVEEFRLSGENPNWEKLKLRHTQFEGKNFGVQFGDKNPVKLLLGLDQQELWMPTELREKWLRAKHLIAYQSKLGWVAGGSFLGIQEFSYDMVKKSEENQGNQPIGTQPRVSRVQPLVKQIKRQGSRASSKLKVPSLRSNFSEETAACNRLLGIKEEEPCLPLKFREPQALQPAQVLVKQDPGLPTGGRCADIPSYPEDIELAKEP